MVALVPYLRWMHLVAAAVWLGGMTDAGEEGDVVALSAAVDSGTHVAAGDSVYGRYAKDVVVDGKDLVVGGRRIPTSRIRDPLQLPWKELRVDLVFECTGAFRTREDLEQHVRAGAPAVLLSAAPRHAAAVADGAAASAFAGR